jgi:hypothetical protein
VECKHCLQFYSFLHSLYSSYVNEHSTSGVPTLEYYCKNNHTCVVEWFITVRLAMNVVLVRVKFTHTLFGEGGLGGGGVGEKGKLVGSNVT